MHTYWQYINPRSIKDQYSKVSNVNNTLKLFDGNSPVTDLNLALVFVLAQGDYALPLK